MMKSLFFIFSFSLLITNSYAKIYAPKGTEYNFRVSTEFYTSSDGDATELAEFHLSHTFGVLQSVEHAAKWGVTSVISEGFGAIKLPATFSIIEDRANEKSVRKIKYKARGRILLRSHAAEKILKTGYLDVPLPYNLDEAFVENCTDEHYNTEGDYWYFNNLYKKECRYLQKEPYSKMAKIYLSPVRGSELEQNPRLDLLRGNNGNGKTFSIYVIHGYAESSTDQKDDGRINFAEANEYFRSLGFKEKVSRSHFNRPLHIFKGPLQLKDGSIIEVEIQSHLLDTEIDSRSLTFARTFKTAVEESDVLAYLGHSGLGGNLDISALEEKAGKFNFPDRKRQIFFFDSCSSYSYYITPFENSRPKSQLDIITNGLASMFETSTPVLEAFINSLLDSSTEGHTWQTILRKMEAPLKGGSYLLNVSGK